ncbi:MAG: hypothetical protein AAB489_04550 [Patescibacteria group bacterium]
MKKKTPETTAELVDASMWDTVDLDPELERIRNLILNRPEDDELLH